MADGRGGKGFGQVINVGTQHSPGDEENRQRCQDGQREYQSEDLWRRFGACAEDVVDFGEGAVAEDGAFSSLGRYGESEDFGLYWRGCAEASNDDGRLKRLGGCEQGGGDFCN